MELAFNGGRFVSFDGELNYKDVLDDFSTAETIRIITYNISKNKYNDALLDRLKTSSADIQIITNVPSRMETYYNTDAGQKMRFTAQQNIKVYLSKLDPDHFPKNFRPFFNVNNHAKLIGTENIVYIGSANYSNESANNIESGILIDDKEFIQSLYTEFFDKVCRESLSYFDENFSAFRLFIFTLYAKFKHHYENLLENLYTDFERSKLVVSDTIFLDINDLDSIYNDLDEIEAVCSLAEDTYDEDYGEYNYGIDKLKEVFNCLSIEWLKNIVSTDGLLYELIAFDENRESSQVLQDEFSAEAYDEYLDEYVERAMSIAHSTYETLYNDFSDEADDFLSEIKKILSALESAVQFTNQWKVPKINPDIDNTQ